MEFDTNAKPIYLQIVDRVCDDILLGRYAVGDRLPSVRDAAADMEVNTNTMMRAYEYMQRNGFIFNKRGIGYFVEENAPMTILNQRREAFFCSEANYFFRRMHIFGITSDELRELYDRFCETSVSNQKKETE